MYSDRKEHTLDLNVELISNRLDWKEKYTYTTSIRLECLLFFDENQVLVLIRWGSSNYLALLKKLYIPDFDKKIVHYWLRRGNSNYSTSLGKSFMVLNFDEESRKLVRPLRQGMREKTSRVGVVCLQILLHRLYNYINLLLTLPFRYTTILISQNLLNIGWSCRFYNAVFNSITFCWVFFLVRSK